MKLNKRIRIILWRLYYKAIDIVRHKSIITELCDDEWGGVKVIRNDLLARVFLYKREGTK